MEARYATNFDEYVGWMALNSPHATVLDWWRRLESALNKYAATLRVASRDVNARQLIQTAIANDPRLEHPVARVLEHMRVLRNRVAHDSRASVSPEQATDYAHQAPSFIWVLAIEE